MNADSGQRESGSASSVILSPCDVARLPLGTTARIGGRVRRGGPAGCMLCDATHALPMRFPPDVLAPAEASLVVVFGTWTAGGFDVLRLDSEHASPRGDGTCHELSRLSDRGVGRYLVQRARMLQLIRAWFDEHAFIEVDSPLRVPSPGLDLHLDAFTSDDAYLITSPEYQLKRLLAGGMPRVVQISHCFRAGERGPFHNSEFLMLEWYRAFAGIDDVIADTEQLIAFAVQGLTGSTCVSRAGLVVDLMPPFHRLRVTDAFDEFAGIGADDVLRMADEDETAYFEVLVERVEPALAKRNRPTVLTDFPARQASLARLSPADPRVCERFEVYAAGLELCNGFGELTDPIEQRQRLVRDQATRREARKPAYPIDERFLDALWDGMPPSGGNAMGLDRLLALCVGAQCVQDVMPFPDDWLGMGRSDGSTLPEKDAAGLPHA